MNTLFKKTGRLFLLSLLLFSIAFHNNASAQAKQKKPQIKSFSKKLFVGKSYYVKVKNRPKKSTLSYSLSKTSRAKINKKTGQLTTRKSGKITIRVRIKSKNRKYKSLHKSVQIYEQTKTSKISGKFLPNATIKTRTAINPWNHSIVLYSSRILLQKEVSSSKITLTGKSNSTTPKLQAHFDSLSSDGKKITYQLDKYSEEKLCPGNGSANGVYKITAPFLSKPLSINYKERLTPNKVQGFVFDSEQRPIFGTTVSLCSINDQNKIMKNISSAKTDKNGHYCISDIHSGQYIIVFQKDEYITSYSQKFNLSQTVLCQNITLKKKQLRLSCKIANAKQNMKGVSVSLKDESNTVLTSGLTDSNGMITFSYNTNISRKNYTKITYKNTIKEGIYCNNTLPDAYTSSQIKLSSYTPNELYYLEVSPASPLSDDRLSYSNYQTISISFCPNNSTSEQLFIDCNLSKIPTTKIKSLYANTDTISSYINTDSTINNSQGSFRTCLYQEDGCQITSTTIPFVNLSFSSHQVQLTNALNSFFTTHNICLPDGKYYISIQPLNKDHSPIATAFLSKISITNNTICPISAFFQKGVSKTAILYGNFTNKVYSSLPYTLYQKQDNKWFALTSLQSSSFEHISNQTYRSSISLPVLEIGQQYKLCSRNPYIDFVDSAEINTTWNFNNTTSNLQFKCQEVLASSHTATLHHHNIKQIIIAENVLLNAQNKKDCVFVDYDKNGTIISACYVNSNEGHSFYTSPHNIFFFDKMETGKSIKTTQASYKNTKFY